MPSETYRVYIRLLRNPATGAAWRGSVGAVHPELSLGPKEPMSTLQGAFSHCSPPDVPPTRALTLRLAMSGVLVVPSAHPSIPRTPQEPGWLVAGWWLKIENPNPLGG